ncbi:MULTISPECIES: hypothetical protein [unclassified Spirosoma]|uniref:hypothetical protein n=1 Tax=unclassified Spirosoma TaxID=2621999 RepID=UPI0009688759|nr:MULTISPECIES: hypothetical protein [unclassified Spirosoma]MBN8823121.1 hypothetical protein [Spirosoma sp.]OJW73210.1 MAG: hypothetical protein BGO59_06920 [Spirosoma sp. 48-14]
MELAHDPTSRPKGGAALFRWILEQRKLEESKPHELTESQKAAIAELKKRNAERGTTVIKA